MASSGKGILSYATDIYKLSSLLLRRVILTKPMNLTAYREKTRQLLLDQSRPPSLPSTAPNLAAVRILEWDREFNSMSYYGVQEYSRRWWNSRSWPALSLFSHSSSASAPPITNFTKSNQNRSSEPPKNNVAKVAFMITSEQRQRLSVELGYTPQDIRSFKPIEALLLLEHGVKKEMMDNDDDDYRVKLNALLVENERLMNADQEHQQQKRGQPKQKEMETVQHSNKAQSTTATTEQSISPEEAQNIHAKPDVAIALLSSEKYEQNIDNDSTSFEGEQRTDGNDSFFPTSAESKDATTLSMPSLESMEKQSPTKTRTTATTTIATDKKKATNKRPPLPPINVTPLDSETLAMKPDVAAVFLSARQKCQEEQQPLAGGMRLEQEEEEEEVEGDDEPCWFEVVERIPSHDDKERVIALFPTKKEALECIRIKETLFHGRANGKEGKNEGNDGEQVVIDTKFFVRRRCSL